MRRAGAMLGDGDDAMLSSDGRAMDANAESGAAVAVEAKRNIGWHRAVVASGDDRTQDDDNTRTSAATPRPYDLWAPAAQRFSTAVGSPAGPAMLPPWVWGRSVGRSGREIPAESRADLAPVPLQIGPPISLPPDAGGDEGLTGGAATRCRRLRRHQPLERFRDKLLTRASRSLAARREEWSSGSRGNCRHARDEAQRVAALDQAIATFPQRVSSWTCNCFRARHGRFLHRRRQSARNTMASFVKSVAG
jgi:hypothetical protein